MTSRASPELPEIDQKSSQYDRNDAALLALETQFNALVEELDRVVQHHRGKAGREALTKEAEATLAHLDPIEQAIMETPACTIAGLGVKARHAAYVLSEYWETPIDRILRCSISAPVILSAFRERETEDTTRVRSAPQIGMRGSHRCKRRQTGLPQ